MFLLEGRGCFGLSAENRVGMSETGGEAGVCIVDERGEDERCCAPERFVGFCE